MSLFKYTAKNEDGEIIAGEIEAESKSAAARILSSKNIIPIDIIDNLDSGLTFFERVSLKEKVVVIRQLATMINAGLPISQSLKTIEVQTTKPSVKKILLSSISDIEGGSPISAAFAKFPEVFSQIDITLISSGETSGTLDKALMRMADQLEKEQSLVRKVRGALVYPSFVAAAVLAIVVLMIVYVMPQMEELYSSFDAKLPLITRIFISAGNILSKIGPFLLLIFVGLGFYLRSAVKRPAGKRVWDELKLKMYGINILLVKMYMARFSRTLSGLVSSGVSLVESLLIVSKAVGNVVYRDIIVKASEDVKAGVPLSESLKANPEFPPVVPQMISVGEKTGEIDGMLSNLADYYEEEVDVAVKSISNLIEPMIIIVSGAFIAVILLAIIMPIYQVGTIV